MGNSTSRSSLPVVDISASVPIDVTFIQDPPVDGVKGERRFSLRPISLGGHGFEHPGRAVRALTGPFPRRRHAPLARVTNAVRGEATERRRCVRASAGSAR